MARTVEFIADWKRRNPSFVDAHPQWGNDDYRYYLIATGCVAPAPPVVLNGEEEADLAAAVLRGMSANARHPEFDALDAVFAWFAANGITLTRGARP